MLQSIVADLLGPAANAEARRFCANSVVSQVLFYHHCRPVVARMFPQIKFDAAGLEQLAHHITEFSVAAIKSLAARPGRRRKPVRDRQPVTDDNIRK